MRVPALVTKTDKATIAGRSRTSGLFRGRKSFKFKERYK